MIAEHGTRRRTQEGTNPAVRFVVALLRVLLVRKNVHSRHLPEKQIDCGKTARNGVGAEGHVASACCVCLCVLNVCSLVRALMNGYFVISFYSSSAVVYFSPN